MSNTISKGTAVVTGASMGIGAVYAHRLAKRGYDLILVARSKDKLEEVADLIQTQTGRKVETLTADLSSLQDIKRVADRLSSDDQITTLVNNAGIASDEKLLDSDPDYLDQMVQLNVVALTRLSIAAASAFVSRGRGFIINIGSVVGLAPELLNGVYSGSKGYVQNFSISLRKELEGTGVTVQVVLPGATATPIWGKIDRPLANLPPEVVMSAEDLVDAALAGLDQGEFFTIPALPNQEDFFAYEKARLALQPNLSRQKPADRYGVNSAELVGAKS